MADAYGLRVWGADGTNIMDTRSRLGKLHAIITTGATNGNYTVPTEISGTVFAGMFFFYGDNYRYCEPSIYISGKVVNWMYNPPPWQSPGNAQIIIGTF